jgi:C_GCAxxG_C_C family probable redox protein
LPHADLPGDDVTFLVAETTRGIVGCAALCDIAPGAGLLRSVAVMPGYRKQNVARHLFQQVLITAENAGVSDLYLLTVTASEYFTPLGFQRKALKEAPASLRQSRHFRSLSAQSANLLYRPVVQLSAPVPADHLADVIARAKANFDEGYHCAESVLLAVSDHLDIRSPLIPSIATGFCHGVAGTWGTCGALSGGILAVNLTCGRHTPDESVGQNYDAVRQLMDDFRKACGGTDCSRLMGCDLDSRDGKKTYHDNQVRQQCREYVGVAAGLAAGIAMQTQLGKSKAAA